MTDDDPTQASGLVLRGTWEVDDREYTATDDLRTRAREAAERWVEDASWADVDEEQYPEFVAGFLAAYEQLPGREEIARAIEAAFPVDQVDDTRNHLHGWYPTRSAAQHLANAVLALIHGDQS